MKEYYLADGIDEQIVDTSDCPVDGAGNVDEADAAFAAIDQLGWMFCTRNKD